MPSLKNDDVVQSNKKRPLLHNNYAVKVLLLTNVITFCRCIVRPVWRDDEQYNVPRNANYSRLPNIKLSCGKAECQCDNKKIWKI